MIDSTRLTIRTNDFRSCRFYFHYIQANVPSSINVVFDVNNPDTALSCRIINDALEAYFPDNSVRLGFIRRMELNLSTTIIAEKNFDWFKDDTRATYWLWGSLFLDSRCNQDINDALDLHSNAWYKDLNIPESPASHSERYNCIVMFIDRLCLQTRRTPALRIWLSKTLNFWRKHATRLTRFKWLQNEGNDIAVWAYHAMLKYQQNHKSTDNDPLNPVAIPHPVNAEEALHSFYALLDLWKIDNEIQKNTITKINKAYYQRTFRKKQAVMKGREEISDEHSKKLSFLASHYHSDKISVLEMLIEDRMRGIEIATNARQIRPRRP